MLQAEPAVCSRTHKHTRFWLGKGMGNGVQHCMASTNAVSPSSTTALWLPAPELDNSETYWGTPTLFFPLCRLHKI